MLVLLVEDLLFRVCFEYSDLGLEVSFWVWVLLCC